jgi:arabinose-5-phosphate isomerase
MKSTLLENKILQMGLETLDIEITTLQALRGSLQQPDFTQTVQVIFEKMALKGRVIVTGIGKSAIIAQKMVATFNSTGTPALFMHAADAIHGDLGMIQTDDVVICLSKSGDTPEIKVLTPLLKQYGNILIGVTANKQSVLGKRADFVLHTPIHREADPNNLAPTASTIAQMAIGDALAMALLTLKGFSKADFARVHPGGALGTQLYLRVRDLMLLHDAPSVLREATLQKVIVEMTSKRLGATVVLNENHSVAGIITDGDLRRMLSKTLDFNGLTADKIMTPNPKTIEPNVLAIHALALMREQSITQLVVVSDDKYQGMIHLHDLLKEGLI